MPKLCQNFIKIRATKNGMELFIKAKLNDAKGNLNKQWYVYYSYQNPSNTNFIRHKIMLSLKLKTKSVRYVIGAKIIKELNQKLINGWNPYENEISSSFNIRQAIKYFLEIKANTLRLRSIHTYTNSAKTFLDFYKKRKEDTMNIESYSQRNAMFFLDTDF